MHRVLFRIPMPFGLEPLQVAAYGAMVALGALLAIYIAAVRAKRVGVNPNLILDLALVLIISGMIGARLFFFVFDDWSEFTGGGVGNALKQFINFPSGGLSFYGALAFGIPAGIIFLRTRMKHIWGVGDIAMPSIALGIAFARIGCYLNGCCFGKPCAGSFPLAQHFPLHEGEGLSIPAQHYLQHHVAQAGLKYMPGHFPPSFEWPLALYPTQLISSLNAFALFIVLSLLFRRRRFDGELFCIFGIWYGISRFLIEFLRADNALTIFGVLTTWQLAGLVLAAGCAVLVPVFQRRGRLTLASA